MSRSPLAAGQPFADHFSALSDRYARARPTYPDGLYAFVAAQAPARELAWDCATGNGQAAIGLARHFARVEASDASATQIEHAMPSARVRYSVQLAEKTGFADASFDAVCIAQALHWFDHERFWAEVKRVLKPRGVVAAWGYDRLRTPDGFHRVFAEHVLGALKPYWPAQSRLLWEGYDGVAFPFERIEAPAFEIRVEWTLEELRAYTETWSGTRNCLDALGPAALDAAWAALGRAWGGSGSRVFTMPMHVLCGRHAG